VNLRHGERTSGSLTRQQAHSKNLTIELNFSFIFLSTAGKHRHH
jgi:hypothetical protein